MGKSKTMIGHAFRSHLHKDYRFDLGAMEGLCFLTYAIMMRPPRIASHTKTLGILSFQRDFESWGRTYEPTQRAAKRNLIENSRLLSGSMPF